MTKIKQLIINCCIREICKLIIKKLFSIMTNLIEYILENLPDSF